MKCQKQGCCNEIPGTRKKGARYCSNLCYYEMKKARSSLRYAALVEPRKENNRCESILAHLYSISELGKPIYADDLLSFKFKYGLSEREFIDSRKRLFKIIGIYGYHIEPNKNLIIWKFRPRH